MPVPLNGFLEVGMACCLQKVSGPTVQCHEQRARGGVFFGLSPNGGLTCLVDGRNHPYITSHGRAPPWGR